MLALPHHTATRGPLAKGVTPVAVTVPRCGPCAFTGSLPAWSTTMWSFSRGMTCSSMRAPGTNCGTGADGQVPAEEAAHDSEHEKTWKRWTCGAPYHWATWSGALRGYSERQKRDSWPLASDDTVKHGNQEDREETGENENDHADERPGALSMATPRRTATVPRGPRPPKTGPAGLAASGGNFGRTTGLSRHRILWSSLDSLGSSAAP